ncbi:MAG: hypothetical protein AAFP78_08975, partial [Pseudomonadota bacterium]
MPPVTVLCVPGPWEDRDTLSKGISAATDGRISVKDDRITSGADGFTSGLEWAWADPAMERAFAVAAQRSPDLEALLPAVRGHRSVAYLTTEEAGPEALAQMHGLATALLDAGGHGVKVEAAGFAHAPAAWRSADETPSVVTLFHLCVVHMVEHPNFFASHGMHQFGLPDTLVFTD